METILRTAAFIALYGMSYGVVLFLISSGLALTLGLMRIINLAHGAFAALGGYLAVLLMNVYTVSFYLAVPVAVAFVVLGSVAVERIFYSRLYDASDLDQVLMTVGLMFLTTAALNFCFGPDLISANLPHSLSISIDLGFRNFQAYRLFVIGLGAALIGALWFLFDRTLFGARLRAAVDNRAMAEAIGIDVRRLYTVAFALGSGLAALGGAIGFPVLPLEPMYPFRYLTLVMIVVALAGQGGIKASVPAALAVGIVDTAARYLFPVAGAFAVYAMFIVVMIRRRDELPHQRHAVHFDTPSSGLRPREIVFWLCAFAVYFLFPGNLSLATGVAIMGLFVVSLDLLIGFAGIVSLAHGVFFGIGAYAAAWITLAGWHEPITGLLAAGAVAALAALLAGPLLLRLSGLRLIMTTFVLGLMVYEVANKASWLSGGDNGLPELKVAPLFNGLQWSVYGKVEYLYALVVLFVLFWVAKRVVASPFGLALRGIRENTSRMALVGAPVALHLLRVYMLSAFMAGVAGALSMQTTRFVSLGVISLNVSLDALVMLVLGGVGSLYGALAGAIVYMIIQRFASEWNPYHWMFIIAFLLLMVVRFGRGGIVGLSGIAMHRLTWAVRSRAL